MAFTSVSLSRQQCRVSSDRSGAVDYEQPRRGGKDLESMLLDDHQISKEQVEKYLQLTSETTQYMYKQYIHT